MEDYINSASPISSAEIKQKHLQSLSSATIRNELAALEDMGYLYQPHTSSGRIPTIEAYRLYVSKLMPKRKLNNAELKKIKSQFNLQMVQLKDVLKKTAQVISEVTNYTSLAFVEDITGAVVENIKIVKLTADSALVIVVTDLGILKDATVNTAEDMSDEFFTAVSNFMVAAFKGRKISEIAKPKNIINEVAKQYELFFDTVLDIIKQYYETVDADDFVLAGASKLLNHPEYSNISKAKAMIAVLESKEDLLPMLKSKDDMNININIGKNNDNDTLADCAVITVGYSMGGKTIGQAGVIGPVRMDYSKVVSVLDYVGKMLAQIPIKGERINVTTNLKVKNITFNENEHENEKDKNKN